VVQKKIVYDQPNDSYTIHRVETDKSIKLLKLIITQSIYYSKIFLSYAKVNSYENSKLNFFVKRNPHSQKIILA